MKKVNMTVRRLTPITWFEQNGFNVGDFGPNNIANAKGISVNTLILV